jgi:alpha-beta hydrolase superfamily lysophospholipase
MLADFVEVQTTDGMTLGGAYFAPSNVESGSTVEAVCFFHGDGGHFYRPLYLELGQRLAEQGIAFLAANRRGHDTVSAGARGGALQKGTLSSRWTSPEWTTPRGWNC